MGFGLDLNDMNLSVKIQLLHRFQIHFLYEKHMMH